MNNLKSRSRVQQITDNRQRLCFNLPECSCSVYKQRRLELFQKYQKLNRNIWMQLAYSKYQFRVMLSTNESMFHYHCNWNVMDYIIKHFCGIPNNNMLTMLDVDFCAPKMDWTQRCHSLDPFWLAVFYTCNEIVFEIIHRILIRQINLKWTRWTLIVFFYIWSSSISIRKVEALPFTIITKLNTTFSKIKKCHKFEWFESAERNWFACKLKSIQFRIPTFMLIHIKYIEIRIYHAIAVFNPLNLNIKKIIFSDTDKIETFNINLDKNYTFAQFLGILVNETTIARGRIFPRRFFFHPIVIHHFGWKRKQRMSDVAVWWQSIGKKDDVIKFDSYVDLSVETVIFILQKFIVQSFQFWNECET